MSNTKGAIQKHLRKCFAAHLSPAGFEVNDDGLERQVGDVSWTVGLHTWGNRDSTEVEVSVQVGVLSRPLYRATLDDRTDLNWCDSQLQATLTGLEGRSNDEARALITSVAEGDIFCLDQVRQIEAVAMPWWATIMSTDELVQAYRKGRFLFKGVARCLWELKVWEGRIDPKTEPFVPPKKHPVFDSVEEAISALAAPDPEVERARKELMGDAES